MILVRVPLICVVPTLSQRLQSSGDRSHEAVKRADALLVLFYHLWATLYDMFLTQYCHRKVADARQGPLSLEPT